MNVSKSLLNEIVEVIQPLLVTNEMLKLHWITSISNPEWMLKPSLKKPSISKEINKNKSRGSVSKNPIKNLGQKQLGKDIKKLKTSSQVGATGAN